MAGARFDSWPAALRLASEEATREHPAVIVIDELPYLVESDPGVPADVQEAWDRELRRRPVLLVCIGSDARMMRSLTQHPAELFGRPTREMAVHPFSPRDLAALSHLDAIGAFDRYLIVGGLPMIARSWPDRSTRRHYLERALADSSSPLVVDGMRILDAEFPGELQARSVLEAIGYGERTFTAISARSGVANHAGLTAALNTLTTKGIVDVRLPYAAPPGRKNKRYVVADPYLRFWLRFVSPGVDEIDRGRGDLLLARIERDWSTFRGAAIEPLVRRSLERCCPPRVSATLATWAATGRAPTSPRSTSSEPPEPEPTRSRSSARSSGARTPLLRVTPGGSPNSAVRCPAPPTPALVGVSRARLREPTPGSDVEVSPEELLRAWPEPCDACRRPGSGARIPSDSGARHRRRAMPPRSRRAGEQAALVQQLGELHGVRGGALAQVVGDDPHVQRALVAGVAADAPDEHLVAGRWRRSPSGRAPRRGRRARARPGAAASSSRARSGESASRVCTLTASEWPLTTGTRTHVALIRIEGRRGSCASR